MKRLVRLLVMLMTVALAVPVFSPVEAGELEDKQDQLRAINREIQQRREQINRARKQEKSIMKEIEVIERGMEATRSEIRRLDARVGSVERHIEMTEADIEEAEANLTERTGYLSERLVAVYENGEVSYLEVLFSATDIADFLSRYDFLKEIFQQDMQLIESIEQERNRLAQTKEELENKKAELLYMRQARQAQEEFLGEQADMKQEVLDSVKAQRQAYEKALDELEATSRKLEQIIRSLQKSGTAYQGTGVFCWPVPGYTRITSDFGMRYHPILQTRRMHTGTDIAAPRGARVVAADGGTVLDTGRMGGYGNTVIVDHGGGISTLYAHLSSIAVSPGTRVDKGDTLGAVGSTGWSTGNHLHFEVRKNGTPVNPREWI
ncbi:MAG: peptidoglycan DD-metalloendopeptidase family protein [Syntrophomonadaceae bacterium]|nr:peptidoglycan DD-metalloendopeptidase family protein [Syntrophomonadaceae bacterium]